MVVLLAGKTTPFRIAMQRKPAAPAPPPHPANCRSVGPDGDFPLPWVRASMERMALKRWRTIISVAANRPRPAATKYPKRHLQLLRQSASTLRFLQPPPPLACDGQHDNFPALAHPDADVQRQGQFYAASCTPKRSGVSTVVSQFVHKAAAVSQTVVRRHSRSPPGGLRPANPVRENNCGMSPATR